MPTGRASLLVAAGLCALAAAASPALLASCSDDGGGSPPAGEPGPTTPSADPGPLRAGAALRVIDLPLGHPHGGYAQSRRIGYRHPPDDPGSPFAEIFPATRGLQSAPTARVVFLDNGHTQLALAKVDAIFTTAELYQRALELTAERTGEDWEGRLFLTSTHSHGAFCRISGHSLLSDFLEDEPEGQQEAIVHGCDTYSQHSVDAIAGAVAEAVGEALENARPAKLGWGAGENTTANSDRRCENDWISGRDDVDRQVTVIRVDDAETGAPIAVAFHYSMHGTIYGGYSWNITVDAPGHAEYKLEELFDEPVVAIYLQGSVGDSSPRGDRAGHKASQGMQRVGWDLARTVKQVWDGVQTKPEISLQGASRWIPLTHRVMGYEPGEFFPDGAGLCNEFSAECVTEPIDPADLLCLAIGLPGGGKYATRLGTARIDDLAVLTMPGEPMASLGRRLEEAAKAEGFADGIALGLAQDDDRYLLLEDDWWSGGYEPTLGFWGPKQGEYLVAQSSDLLHEMVTGEALVKRNAQVPDLSPRDTPQVEPTESATLPQVIEDVPGNAERMTELVFGFQGGDPALGTPEVVLQVQPTAGGTWGTVSTNGWRPVSNLRGYELPTFYEAVPSYRDEPGARTREYRWKVIYEPPPDLPEGTYHLLATGRALAGGVTMDYELNSAPVRIGPSRGLQVDAAVSAAGGSLRVQATLLYPAQAPRYAQGISVDEWQLGAFRMIDPRFSPPFVPVAEGGVAAAAAEVAKDSGAPQPLALSWRAVELESDHPGPYEPGAGPGFEGELATSGPGRYEVTFPAGALTDAHGNANAATTVAIDVP